MSDTVIKVENLSKQYRLGLVGTGTLSHDINRWWHRIRGKEDPYIKVTEVNDRTKSSSNSTLPPSEYVWALKDINFEVKQGEVLGIIGRNGAGKSTLLKVLSRVTAPTTGQVKVKGRIASLLEVGTGFHPELTGRENIYLNGAIMGMTKAEVTSKLDEIVDFSGCERYIDTPVKRYSSGMTVRLGFAVAAHLDPEILIVDEVLAVGDAEFQKKCLGKMKDVAGHGRTVLFVSHNMSAVLKLCTKALIINQGIISGYGGAETIVNNYLNKEVGCLRGYRDLNDAKRWPGSQIELINWISVHKSNRTEAYRFNTGDDILLRIGYHIDSKILAYCQINILNNMEERLLSVRSTQERQGKPLELEGEGCIECLIPDIRLQSGLYNIMIEIGRQFPSQEWLDCIPEAIMIEVELGDYLGKGQITYGHGVIAQKSVWLHSNLASPSLKSVCDTNRISNEVNHETDN